MIDWLEIIFRWILGLQLVFWGLNGFFRWKPIPPSAEFINEFTELCVRSKFIMPTAKTFEVLFGLFLLAGFAVGLALIALAPIIFVITGLHLFHNQKPWGVLSTITLPFILTVGLNFESWISVTI